MFSWNRSCARRSQDDLGHAAWRHAKRPGLDFQRRTDVHARHFDGTWLINCEFAVGRLFSHAPAYLAYVPPTDVRQLW